MSSRLSEKLFERAQQTIPGGVNSPVRAWRSVGGVPRFIQRAHGATITDVDGVTYIDYVGSWGPMILGHAHGHVVSAVQQALRDGCSYGAPTVREVDLAEQLVDTFPSIEQVRLVSSGTEAAMTAIRLARAYTQRTKIVKFAGCYHGHSDSLLVRAGSGAMTFGTPDSAGVAEAVASQTVVATFNDSEEIERLFHSHGNEIAGVIVEPVVGNMGVIEPAPGFLETLRAVTRSHRTVLIFDEVMTGFRVGYGGVQTERNLPPDLTCLGKIIGGGMPLAAVGGRRDIMRQLAPEGPVYQAGTLSGNPLAVAAGLATLEVLHKSGTYERLEEMGARLQEGLRDALTATGSTGCVNRVGSMWTLFLGVAAVRDPRDAQACDREAFSLYFSHMLGEGIYLPPSPFEAAFLSLAHSEADIDRTVAAARRACDEIRRNRG